MAGARASHLALTEAIIAQHTAPAIVVQYLADAGDDVDGPVPRAVPDPETAARLWDAGRLGRRWVAARSHDVAYLAKARADDDPSVIAAAVGNTAYRLEDRLAAAPRDGLSLCACLRGLDVQERWEYVEALGLDRVAHGEWRPVVEAAYHTGPVALRALQSHTTGSAALRTHLATIVRETPPQPDALRWVYRALPRETLSAVRNGTTRHLDAWLTTLDGFPARVRKTAASYGLPYNVLVHLHRDGEDGPRRAFRIRRRRYLGAELYDRDRHHFYRRRRVRWRHIRHIVGLHDLVTAAVVLRSLRLRGWRPAQVAAIVAHMDRPELSNHALTLLAGVPWCGDVVARHLARLRSASEWESHSINRELAWCPSSTRMRVVDGSPWLINHARAEDMDPAVFARQVARDPHGAWIRRWLDTTYLTDPATPAYGRIGGDGRWRLEYVARAGVTRFDTWHIDARRSAVAYWETLLGADADAWQMLAYLLPAWHLSVHELGVAAAKLAGSAPRR